MLRAEVERLQVEVREYRKRLSWVSSGNGFSTMSALQNVNSRNLAGLSNNDFLFDFPKFGDLPGNHILSNGSLAKSLQNKVQNKANGTTSTAGSVPSSNIPGVLGRGSVGATGQQTSKQSSRAAPNGVPNSLNTPNGGKDAVNGYSKAGSKRTSTRTGVNGTSTYQGQIPGSSGASNSDSPCSSSESQHGQASSMGTSPEPSLNSPSVSKPNEMALDGCSSEHVCNNNSTINGEKSFCEQLGLACGNINNPVPAALDPSNNNLSSRMPGQYQNHVSSSSSSQPPPPQQQQSLSFDWLAQQNGGSFDPVLFNDYREPQDAVLSQDFGTFFNDAFPLPDLGSPFRNLDDVASPPAPKKDLVAEIDGKLDEDDEVVPGEDKSQMLDCTKIWYVLNPPSLYFCLVFLNHADYLSFRDRLQSMEKFRNGEIDVDSLCTELRTKARCSEGGVVVNKRDVEDIMGRVK
jgi:AP-1-like factor